MAYILHFHSGHPDIKNSVSESGVLDKAATKDSDIYQPIEKVTAYLSY